MVNFLKRIIIGISALLFLVAIYILFVFVRITKYLKLLTAKKAK